MTPDYETEETTFGYLFGALPRPTGKDGKTVLIDALDCPMERYVLLPSEDPKAKPVSTDTPKDLETPAPLFVSEGKSAWELWGLHKQRRALQKEYLDHWEATISKTGTGRPVDAIISPAAAYPAPPHGLNSYCSCPVCSAD
jgi:hypothetical protein